jgi:hypothetical protein
MNNSCNKCALLCKQPKGVNVLFCPKFTKVTLESFKNLNKKIRESIKLKNSSDRKQIRLLLAPLQKQKELLYARKIGKQKYRRSQRYLAELFRTKTRNVLIRKSKSKIALEILGCSFIFFKHHLESQFKDGMTWKNCGLGDKGKKEWHIDHIYPCASFNLKKIDEQQICFHWSNHQPLWAEENLRKGCK